MSFSAELAFAAANRKHKREEIKDEIEAFLKIGAPVVKVAKIDTPVKIGVLPKSPSPTKINTVATKIEIKTKPIKPPVKRSKHEDALVPSQELTAEILSNMPLFSPSPSTPSSSSAPHPFTPPTPARAMLPIRPPIQVQSQPIQPQFQTTANHTPHQSLVTVQFELVQAQSTPIQHQSTPIQLQSQPITPQFGPITPQQFGFQFQPTQLLSHLTQPTQLLPHPTPLSSTLLPPTNAQHQAIHQFQAQFSLQQPPPPIIPTSTPIKYDYARNNNNLNNNKNAAQSQSGTDIGVSVTTPVPHASGGIHHDVSNFVDRTTTDSRSDTQRNSGNDVEMEQASSMIGGRVGEGEKRKEQKRKSGKEEGPK
jgi:hypothetical protein